MRSVRRYDVLAVAGCPGRDSIEFAHLPLPRYLGVHRSDVVRIGKQHLPNGWLVFHREAAYP